MPKDKRIANIKQNHDPTTFEDFSVKQCVVSLTNIIGLSYKELAKCIQRCLKLNANHNESHSTSKKFLNSGIGVLYA